ncbi:MAG TPA: hypothetical protein VFA10_16765 [Ktedonobacteraceae bacterium]|nr:hypothetical protein [Ktedonobacteraceae bacterium]
MALLYPIDGAPTAIIPQQSRFTRTELERLLGGPIFYYRKTRQIAVDCFEPYGEIIVVRTNSILVLPRNGTIEQRVVGCSLLWGPIIALDSSELNDTLPWYLTSIIWRRGDSD